VSLQLTKSSPLHAHRLFMSPACIGIHESEPSIFVSPMPGRWVVGSGGWWLGVP